MRFAWTSGTKKKRQDGRSARGIAQRRKSGGQHTLRFESLECRRLLTFGPAGLAAPGYQLIAPSTSDRPLVQSGPSGYSPAAIRQAYGFNNIKFTNGVIGNGNGTTIAIVDAYDDPTLASDLHQFDQQFGLADPALSKVNEFGGSRLPSANSNWATEIALDVEWAHAIAPAARILLVEAASNSESDLFQAASYAASQSGVVTVSMSWDGGEFSGENSFDSIFQTPSGHPGVTFLAASGDSGAPVSYPAASPNVVSVGGTTLILNSSNAIVQETAWNGSGGGISTYETQPSYQKGVVTQTSSSRTNPDVAYDSNPNTGFPVYDSYGYSSPWLQVGGTSDAAPQWAGLMAIADQGRILAGKGPLNGATQTLPLLYSAPVGDFNDITSGSSSGRPPYAAGPGYDLASGRGTPVANLLVPYLVQSSVAPPAPTAPAATHFTVSTATSSAAAGSAVSITVTALTTGNSTATGYTGTVQFSSSDPGAILPANYTFTSADQGVHIFSLTLATAGSRSITVTDTVSNTLVGSASVAVTPSAAAKVVFLQQPSNAAPGATISPAVTVELLDAYNNLETSGAVTIAIGSNPGGGTLAGTTTATASGGMATFSNLSIKTAGSGYTLVASSGNLHVASAAFNIATVATSVIEGFESGNLGLYTDVGVAWRPSAAAQAVAAHDGSYGLLETGGNDWIYRDDAAAQVVPGDTISVWLQFTTTPAGRAYFAFGASAAGAFSLVAAPNTDQLLLQNNLGFTFTNIAAAPQSYQPDHWYRLEVDWSTSGAIVGKLFDSDGTTPLASVSATTTAITAGGIGFRSTSPYNTYWDTVTVTSGETSAAATTSNNDPMSSGDTANSAPAAGDLLWIGSGQALLSDPPGVSLAQERAMDVLLASYAKYGMVSAAVTSTGSAEEEPASNGHLGDDMLSNDDYSRAETEPTAIGQGLAASNVLADLATLAQLPDRGI